MTIAIAALLILFAALVIYLAVKLPIDFGSIEDMFDFEIFDIDAFDD